MLTSCYHYGLKLIKSQCDDVREFQLNGLHIAHASGIQNSDTYYIHSNNCSRGIVASKRVLLYCVNIELANYLSV